jgi:hypothetical protein
MSGFNFTGNLNIQLAQGALRSVSQQIRAGVSDVSANVGINVSKQGMTSLAELRSQTTSLTANLATLNAQAAATSTSLSSLASSATRLSSAASTSQAAIAGMIGPTRQASAAAKDASDSFEQLGSRAQTSLQRFLAFSVGVGASLSALRGFSSIIADAIGFESQLNKISKYPMHQRAASPASVLRSVDCRLASAFHRRNLLVRHSSCQQWALRRMRQRPHWAPWRRLPSRQVSKIFQQLQNLLSRLFVNSIWKSRIWTRYSGAFPLCRQSSERLATTYWVAFRRAVPPYMRLVQTSRSMRHS